jgi:hypothetical protein
MHKAYTCIIHLDTTTLPQQKFKCDTQMNNNVLPVLINLVYTSALAHMWASTHTHAHALVHPPTCPPFGIRKPPVCESLFLINVIIRTQTSTVTLELVCFCCSQLAGRDLRRGRDHLMWVLLQFISGSIQRNPVSYVCGHTSD